ncbi:MAG: formylglycine-generating enzyme family protein [Bacteroidales bacterium]|nr:formylglycine-generating enzyme family protein [Bacteroidales bacterium]
MIKNYLLTGLISLLAVQCYSQAPEMVSVAGGTFYMGNDYTISVGQKSIEDEAPEHKVTLNSFLMSKTEITFELYDLFCEATGVEKPDDGRFGRGQMPAVNVSWNNAIMFCNWLSKCEGLDKYYQTKIDSLGMTVSIIEGANGYRLPTEAEWEYAARGGNTKKSYSYSGSNDYNKVAWCRRNCSSPKQVATKEPNSLGLYDMSGNAWEWVWDYYDRNYYKNSPEDNPKGPEKGNTRVYRGGNWNSNLDDMRMTGRYFFAPNKSTNMIGFRIVRSN